MQVTRPNEIRRPGVRLHPKACAALGHEAERATPKHLRTPVPRACMHALGTGYARKSGEPLGFRPIDSGHLALLSPSCRLPVASLSLFWHFQPPVAPLSLACRFPVAVLSLPCRSPVASLSLSCRPPVAILSLPVAFVSFPVAMLLFAWRLPVALLAVPCGAALCCAVPCGAELCARVSTVGDGVEQAPCVLSCAANLQIVLNVFLVQILKMHKCEARVSPRRYYPLRHTFSSAQAASTASAVKVFRSSNCVNRLFIIV